MSVKPLLRTHNERMKKIKIYNARSYCKFLMKPNPKYIIIPGEIIITDGNVCFINSEKLRKLYGVNAIECYFLPSDVHCIFYPDGGHSITYSTTRQKKLIDNYIRLMPQPDGDYSLDRAKTDFVRRKFTE